MKKTICGALLLSVAVMSGVSAAGVPITEKGEARAVIVHNGNTNRPAEVAGVRDAQFIKSSVETLNRYLKQITGAELPVVATVADAGDKPAIVLELVAKVPGASDRPTGAQAYRIKADGNRLTLTASTPLGLHNAIHGLLEDHLGCRFYTFARKGLSYDGPGFEVVPKQPTLAFDKLDDLQKQKTAYEKELSLDSPESRDRDAGR